eukprot:4700137-Amphidinium_carterae.1
MGSNAITCDCLLGREETLFGDTPPETWHCCSPHPIYLSPVPRSWPDCLLDEGELGPTALGLEASA